MGIRQLTFEKGEELNIRECMKLPKNTSIETLQEYANKADAMIVKSGKSYFDVAARPEIYEAAEEFDLSSLTPIDQREMRRTEITPAFDESVENDPMAMLYQNTSQPEEEEYEEYERKTYYLRPNQIEALRLICFKQVKDVSEAVRDLLDAAIAAKGEEFGVDFLAEADKNLLAMPRKPKKRKKRKPRQ